MHRAAASWIARLPALLVVAAVFALWLHGPVAQLVDYHDFSDQRRLLGIPHALNVLSNLGFALVGAWGLWRTGGPHAMPGLGRGARGYRLFLVAFTLTALGSGWYHLDPDNARLFWDRLPIALASAGLVAAVQAETSLRVPPRDWTWLLAIAGAASVVWWAWTDRRGNGDCARRLRPTALRHNASRRRSLAARGSLGLRRRAGDVNLLGRAAECLFALLHGPDRLDLRPLSPR